jgi:hypothetical protein
MPVSVGFGASSATSGCRRPPIRTVKVFGINSSYFSFKDVFMTENILLHTLSIFRGLTPTISFQYNPFQKLVEEISSQRFLDFGGGPGEQLFEVA